MIIIICNKEFSLTKIQKELEKNLDRGLLFMFNKFVRSYFLFICVRYHKYIFKDTKY